jgi:hypothetical protein
LDSQSWPHQILAASRIEGVARAAFKAAARQRPGQRIRLRRGREIIDTTDWGLAGLAEAPTKSIVRQGPQARAAAIQAWRMRDRTEAEIRERRTSEVRLWVKIERVVIIVTMLACTMATVTLISRCF